MTEHDPNKFVRAFSSKLATRSRHVSVLLGAGTSRAAGLPDIKGLTKIVLDKLTGPEKEQFEAQLKTRNLEEALSRVRRIQALLSAGQELDGLTAESAAELDRSVCRHIIEALSIEHANLIPARQFARWVRRSNYQMPLEIFTVNYDLVLETALDKHKAPYFDGFCGVVEARFHVDLVEGESASGPLPSFFSRLWKLHGSVNWAWRERRLLDMDVLSKGGRLPQSTLLSSSTMNRVVTHLSYCRIALGDRSTFQNRCCWYRGMRSATNISMS